MPYTPPNTVSGSDVLTAALWNTQIKDNMAVLRNPESCCVLTNTEKSLTTGHNQVSWDVLGWDTDTNPTAMWSAADPTTVYPRTAGIYNIHFAGYAVQVSGAASSVVAAQVLIYNSTTASYDYGASADLTIKGTAPNQAAEWCVNFGLFRLAAGQGVRFVFFKNFSTPVWQLFTAGGNPAAITAYDCRASITRVSGI
jgi:hypothetical protein